MAFDRADVLRAEVSTDRDQLLLMVRDEDPSIRALALGSLSRIGAASAELLNNALRDDDRNVRCRALEVSYPVSEVQIGHLLRDPDDLVVETCCWALGERQDASKEIIDGLCAVATDHEVPICREAAIAALGALGDEAGLDAILGGMNDKPAVRRRAVLALAPFEGPRVTAALEDALTDRDRQVRQAAEDLL